MPQQLSQTLDLILKQTSRAFYLSLAILPARSRRPLSLAYLLARTADTIADSEGRQVGDRRETLTELRRLVNSGERLVGLDLTPYHPEHSGERTLLEHTQDLLDELLLTPSPQRESIQQVVGTLIEGMLWDQELFEDPALAGLTDDELERYTYLVAGCVGPFWSEVCAGEDESLAVLTSPQNHDTAVEFGKGLQWVNILRDIPKDQEDGRYYLPDLSASDFKERFALSGSRALKALSRANNYPLLFPCTYPRDRLAVFLPLVLGWRTLTKLFAVGGPRRKVRVKVTRTEVFCWMAVGSLVILNDRLLKFVLEQLHKQARRALETLEL